MGFQGLKLRSLFEEEVLWEGIIQVLKGDAADMVRLLGPTPPLMQLWTNLTLCMVWCPPLMS